jgi:hypothetical protein
MGSSTELTRVLSATRILIVIVALDERSIAGHALDTMFFRVGGQSRFPTSGSSVCPRSQLDSLNAFSSALTSCRLLIALQRVGRIASSMSGALASPSRRDEGEEQGDCLFASSDHIDVTPRPNQPNPTQNYHVQFVVPPYVRGNQSGYRQHLKFQN